jgi:hypothetical protein
VADGVEEIVVRLCPSCEGYAASPHGTRTETATCAKTANADGSCVREEFYSFWLERFTAEELREMGRAVWSSGG